MTKKGSAHNFPFGTSLDDVAKSLNAHYADKLRSPVGWYGTAAVNISGDEKNEPTAWRFARTAKGWDVYQLAGTITDLVTVNTGKFVPIAAPTVPTSPETPTAEMPKPPRRGK